MVVESTSGRSGKVYDPATGAVQAEVDFASVAELDAAVAAAKTALPAWRATNLSRRAEVMFRLRELVDANRKEIATLLTGVLILPAALTWYGAWRAKRSAAGRR